MSNTPPANITPSPVWALLSPIGRIGRSPYWLCFALIWTVIAIAFNMWWSTVDFSGIDLTQETIPLGEFMGSNPLFPFLFFALQWVELALVIKRLHDIGLSGFFGLLILVPGLNVLIVLGAGFVPGKTEPNRHGPLPNSYWRRR